MVWSRDLRQPQTSAPPVHLSRVEAPPGHRVSAALNAWTGRTLNASPPAERPRAGLPGRAAPRRASSSMTGYALRASAATSVEEEARSGKRSRSFLTTTESAVAGALRRRCRSIVGQRSFASTRAALHGRAASCCAGPEPIRMPEQAAAPPSPFEPGSRSNHDFHWLLGHGPAEAGTSRSSRPTPNMVAVAQRIAEAKPSPRTMGWSAERRAAQRTISSAQRRSAPVAAAGAVGFVLLIAVPTWRTCCSPGARRGSARWAVRAVDGRVAARRSPAAALTESLVARARDPAAPRASCRLRRCCR